MPPKPPHEAVSDHMNCASGKAVIAFTTWSDARLVASSDASGAACMKKLMWLWSSTGASSRREYWYSGHARQHDEHRGRDDRPAHLQGAVEQPLVAAAHRLEAAVARAW